MIKVTVHRPQLSNNNFPAKVAFKYGIYWIFNTAFTMFTENLAGFLLVYFLKNINYCVNGNLS